MVYYTLIKEILKDGKERTYEQVWLEIRQRFGINPNYHRIKSLLCKMTRKGVVKVVNPGRRKRIIKINTGGQIDINNTKNK